MVTASASSLSKVLSLKISEYDTVILNLSKADRHTPDIIGGSPLCSHLEIINSSCAKCSAFVGNIGYEPNPITSYMHVNSLCSKITNATNIYVIHDKLIPIDFKIYSSLMKSKLNYHRSVVFTSDKIINVYSKSPIIKRYSHYGFGYLNYLISLKNLGKVFWINPTKAEIQLKSDFLVIKDK